MREQRVPAAGVEKKVARDPVHTDMYLPERLSKALEFDDLRAIS